MRTSPCALPVLVGALTICASSCSGDAGGAVDAGEWSLREDLVIGSLTGSDGRPTFGLVSEVVGTPDGGVLVVDVQRPAVLRFNSSGEFVHQLGRVGDGPGEYRDVSGIAVLSDGTVLVRDPRRALLLFDDDGTLNSERRVVVDYVGASPVSVSDEAVLIRTPATPFRLETMWAAKTHIFTRVPLDGGPVDTLSVLPRHPREDLYWAPFHPKYHIEWLSDGTFVHGAGSEDSLLVVSLQDTTILRLPHPPDRLPLSDWIRQDIEEHRAALERRGNMSIPYYPEPPSALPHFERIVISRDDELWIQRPVDAADHPVTYRMDVFSRNGDRLGHVRIPQGLQVHSVVDDYLWGVRRGEYDEQYVVRFSVVRWSAQSS